MKVLYWGTYDKTVPRNQIIINGLTQNGVEVQELNARVWDGINFSGSSLKRAVKLLMGYTLTYPQLIWKFLRADKPDVVFVGYMGLFDVVVLWPLAKLKSVPIYWDVFISIYDTTVIDRKLLKVGSFLAKCLYAFEWLALRCADKVMMDTKTHAEYLCELYSLSEDKALDVPVGADGLVFKYEVPAPVTDKLEVLFYGSMIPLHGVEVILEAAGVLKNENVRWSIVGSGQEQKLVEDFVEANPEIDLEWTKWLGLDELVAKIHASHVCLGIFGTTGKASRVVPNKLYQALLCGRPVITMASPAVEELADDVRSYVHLANGPDELAKAIMDMSSIGPIELPPLQNRMGTVAVTAGLAKKLELAC